MVPPRRANMIASVRSAETGETFAATYGKDELVLRHGWMKATYLRLE